MSKLRKSQIKCIGEDVRMLADMLHNKTSLNYLCKIDFPAYTDRQIGEAVLKIVKAAKEEI